MAHAQLDYLLHHLHHLVGATEDLTDGQLLERFISRREEAAFTALVQRHGPMVLGVCQRELANEAHTADAFQATFLVLARKAGSIRKRDSVGSWLHGVAYRIARRAKVEAARRRAYERQVVEMPRADPLAAVVWRDLRPVLDEELDQLPEKYRAPLVLCYLEGKTHEEAARHLGWTNGTVCGRLARARDLLRGRLVRRGVVLSVSLMPAVLSQHASAAVPAPLVVATAKAAFLDTAGKATGGAISAQATWLARDALKALLVAKLKIAAAFLLAVSVAGSAGGVFLYQAHTKDPSASRASEEVSGPKDASPLPDTPSLPGVLRLSCKSPVHTVAVSPDGKTVAAGDSDRTIHLWQAATGRELSPVVGHQGAVSAIAFSPDSKILASAGYDGALRLWDVATGSGLRTLEGHEDVVTAVTFSPDGKTLAAAGADGKIRLWEVSTGRALRSCAGHRGRVWSATWAGDGKTLASGGGDKTLRLWDAATGRELRRLGEHMSGVFAVAFTPNGKILASSENNQVRLWNVSTGERITEAMAPQTEVIYFAFSPDGHSLAWADGRHRIHLWELATGGERLQLAGHQQTISGLTFAPDGKRLVTGSMDGTVGVWDFSSRVRPVRSPAVLLSPGDVETLWTDLAGEDAARAYAVMWALAAVPRQTVPFLQERLQGTPQARQQLARLIADLDHDRFAVREKATVELKKMGEWIVPALRQTLAGRPSPEVRRRLERLLDEITRPRGTGPSTATLQTLRALEVLELIGNLEARQVLEALAQGMAEAPLTQEARAAVERLIRRSGTTP
jgi:RNA polymerase sigma factor (sigma-70 family)